MNSILKVEKEVELKFWGLTILNVNPWRFKKKAFVWIYKKNLENLCFDQQSVYNLRQNWFKIILIFLFIVEG